MPNRQWRRNSRRQSQQGVHLPLQRGNPRQLHHTLSWWYCDFKITAFNDVIARFGRRHARFWQPWFTIGIGFGTMSILGVTLILCWELFSAAYLWNYEAGNLSKEWLFGMSWFSASNFLVMDFGVMVYSTLVSAFVHELGHALAAASQGIQMEFVAVFLAVIFPGAFVAFNYDLIQNSTPFIRLQVYCAGIWHNVVLCGFCWSMLLFLPTLLRPFYMHNEAPMVLDVAPNSLLSRYLSQGDAIVSLDGKYIHNPQQWVEKLVQMDTEMANNSGEIISGKGYCFPTSVVENNIKLPYFFNHNSSCPNDLTAFVNLPCPTSNLSDTKTENKYCLISADIVQRKKCGDGWEIANVGRNCTCQEDELCMVPLQIPGETWVEISFSRPYSSECLNEEKKQSSTDLKKCGGVFVFVGDPISIAMSFKLSAYKPRWTSGVLGFYLPTLLEKDSKKHSNVCDSQNRVRTSFPLRSMSDDFTIIGNICDQPESQNLNMKCCRVIKSKNPWKKKEKEEKIRGLPV